MNWRTERLPGRFIGGPFDGYTVPWSAVDQQHWRTWPRLPSPLTPTTTATPTDYRALPVQFPGYAATHTYFVAPGITDDEALTQVQEKRR